MEAEKILPNIGLKGEGDRNTFGFQQTQAPPGEYEWEDPKHLELGFPGGAVVENLPANAGDTGSSPGLGRSHMPRSNSAREPQLLSLRVWSLCSATRGRDSERPAHRDEEWPPLAPTRESPRTETKTQQSHTYIHKKNVSREE